MIEGPHIVGFSPAAFCINLTSALASARLLWSGSASMNFATLTLVGLVLLSAIYPPPFQCSQRSFGVMVSFPLQKLRHRLDIQIRLVHERHVSGLRQNHQL